MTRAVGRASVPAFPPLPARPAPGRFLEGAAQNLEVRPDGSQVYWVAPPPDPPPRCRHPHDVAVSPSWAAFRAGPGNRLADWCCATCGKHFLVDVPGHRSTE